MDLLPRPSVCVCPERVLWQNGSLDPGAIWGDEWGRAWYGRIRWVVIVEGEEAVWGEFGASHCNQWDLCDALLSNYFEDLLYLLTGGSIV